MTNPPLSPLARFALPASLFIAFAAQATVNQLPGPVPLALYALAVAALLLALRQTPPEPHLTLQDAPQWHVQIACLTALCALGAFYRLYQIGSLPPGVWFDEAANGVRTYLMRGQPYRPFAWDLYANETLYIYLLMGPIGLWGPSELSLRAVSLMVGIFTVPAFYLLAREFVRPRIALASCALLAVSHWHAHFSRLAFRAILLPLFSTLAIAFLMRGIRRRKYIEFLLAGLFLGLSLHTYTAGYLFGLFALVVLGAVVWSFARTAGELRRLALKLCATALVAAVVAAPIVAYVLSNPHVVSTHPRDVSVFTSEDRTAPLPRTLAKTLSDTLLIFNRNADDNPRHAPPSQPALELPTAALFVLGLVVALRRRTMWTILACLWLAVMLVPGIFSLPSPHSLRTLGSLPAAFLMPALALDCLERQRCWRPWLFTVMIALLVAAAAISSFKVYFLHYPQTAGLWDAFNVASTAISKAARTARLQNHRVLLHPSLPDINGQVVYWFFNGQKAESPFNLTPHLPLRPEANRASVLLLGKYQMDALPLIRAISPPTGPSRLLFSPQGRLVMAELRYEPHSAPWAVLTERLYAHDSPHVPVSIRQVSALPVWPDEPSALRPPFRLEWTGGLFAHTTGLYTFEAVTDLPLTIRVNDEMVLDKPTSAPDEPHRAQVFLPIGLHSLSIVLDGVHEPEAFRVRWRPPGEVFAPLSNLCRFDPASHGLLARYWRGTDWAGTPAFIQRDLIVFPNVPIEGPFCVEWTGWLIIAHEGPHEFELLSDDGSLLYLNDELVIDNSGLHPPQSRYGRAHLPAGLHAIRLRYFDAGGLKVLHFRWRHGHEPWQPVPWTALQVPDQWR